MPAKPDVIAAIATAPGLGGIGVVRVSGQALSGLAHQLLGFLPPPRHASYASFLDGQGAALDRGIALFFPAPHSYTGEDVLELQGHGGPVVLRMILQRCLDLGARLAQPGEFTQRAFLNGKLDLAQAESVADLIAARTDEAARSAARSLQGDFSTAVQALVAELIHVRTRVEAGMDFPEEPLDLPAIRQQNARLEALSARIEALLATARQGSLLREGAQIVLVGQPNVGKSSLLNRLSGEEAALVSDIPGTTRDIIRQTIQIRGVPLNIIDTAGLRESSDTIERLGIALTHKAIENADVVVVLLDVRDGVTPDDGSIIHKIPSATPRLYVHNKIDLVGRPPSTEAGADGRHVFLSAQSGEGVDLLRDALADLVGWHPESGVFMARERHVRALIEARDCLLRAHLPSAGDELQAEELRLAQRALGSIVGEFTADDLLGEIFRSFCIGK